MRGPTTLNLYLRKLVRLARGRLHALRRDDLQVVRLAPPGSARGRVLLSYILEPWLLARDAQPSHHHTHDWESLAIGRTYLNLGYAVDVVAWTNQRFEPIDSYDLVIDARYNLERLADRLGARCRRVFHADTAHCEVHNRAEATRLAELAARRGVRLQPRRHMTPNRAVELADAVSVLGNEFTIDSYRPFGKPIHRVPISTPLLFPWPEERDLAQARRRFLWFGSGGMVHKGLDLVLEAFATAPDLELVVCGPVENEIDFVRAYRRELYETPNIRVAGFVDIASTRFTELSSSAIGLVYPSSSEGGGGSVITCMHAGLVPIVTREASVDVDPAHGVLLGGHTVAEIRDACQSLAARPDGELDALARASWEYARAHHTRARFTEVYGEVAERLLAITR